MKWQRLGIDAIKDGGLKLVYTDAVRDERIAKPSKTMEVMSHFGCALARHVMTNRPNTQHGIWIWQNGKEEPALFGALFVELDYPKTFGILYGIDTTRDYNKDDMYGD